MNLIKKYDYLIVGAGLYGATVACRLKEMGKSVLVVDRRNHIAGNAYCQEQDGIFVHKYGAHIFHTSNEDVWNFVTSHTKMQAFINSPVANYKGKEYPLPFNLNTFKALWGINSAEEAKAIIEGQRRECNISSPRNLEEQALYLVGRDIYNTLIKGYTEKQWGRPCKELPSYIIKRIPVRFYADNNYFDDKYQGIPLKGYTALVEELLKGCDVELNCDFIKERERLESISEKTIYTGALDEFYNYQYGKLEYRTLQFTEEKLDTEFFQKRAVTNYTDKEIPYTRIIEHKHFLDTKSPITIISKEYPKEWQPGDEPYYPIADEQNLLLYSKYHSLAQKEPRTIFGGRLAEYRYYDMDDVIQKALELCL